MKNEFMKNVTEYSRKDVSLFLNIKTLADLKKVIQKVSESLNDDCNVYFAGADGMAVICENGNVVIEENDYAMDTLYELMEDADDETDD